MATVILVSVKGNAQTEKDEFYDIRVKKVLDAEEIEYTITKNNNFKIVVTTEEEPTVRNHTVFIMSKTQNYSDFEIREISSPGLKIKRSAISDSMMYDLLLQSGNIKMGSWELKEYEGEDYSFFTFTIKIGVNIENKHLTSLIFLVASEADRVEKLYGNKYD